MAADRRGMHSEHNQRELHCTLSKTAIARHPGGYPKCSERQNSSVAQVSIQSATSDPSTPVETAVKYLNDGTLDSGAGEASGENGSYGSSRQDVMRCDVLYSCSGLGFLSRPI